MKLEAALNMLFRCIGDAVTGMKRKCSSDKLDSETYQAWNFAAHGLVNSLLHGHGESHSRPNLRSNLSNRNMTVFAMNPQFLSHMFSLFSHFLVKFHGVKFQNLPTWLGPQPNGCRAQCSRGSWACQVGRLRMSIALAQLTTDSLKRLETNKCCFTFDIFDSCGS